MNIYSVVIVLEFMKNQNHLKITNFANEDKKKYQLLDNALEEVYLKLTNEERNEKDDNDNVIKNPLK
ncbi:2699_t:CDS:2 [Entrophospora sp. SA101]|nr:2699_t:CDS:2 [Entrophospora sp. SA101]